jgi:hypothetical protein
VRLHLPNARLAFSDPTAAYQCERGHVNQTLNNKVGAAVGQFYIANRMIIGDPFCVAVTG